MTTVAEIEHAVEHLPQEDVEELTTWLVEYQCALSASTEMFHQYEAEETDQDSQWIGEQ